MNQEVISTDPKTGGQKAVKQARFDLIPPKALWSLAEVYGFGCKKYDDNNWLKGYKWGLTIGAMERHISLFKQGEYLDEESGLPHLAHAMWHCCTLMTFHDEGLGEDDRMFTVIDKMDPRNQELKSIYEELGRLE